MLSLDEILRSIFDKCANSGHDTNKSWPFCFWMREFGTEIIFMQRIGDERAGDVYQSQPPKTAHPKHHEKTS
jgi:hypothetical protein